MSAGAVPGAVPGVIASALPGAIIGASLALLGCVVGVRALLDGLRDRRALGAFLEGAVPGGRIRTREELVALRSAVRARVRFDTDRLDERRPPLRHPARRILEEGRGFCGENARVSVLLLLRGGVRAHRLYLFGPRWGHVVVAHVWEGAWRVFDAHDDPRTCPPDDALGRIAVDDLASFPNTVVDNPWRGASWAKAARRVPAVARAHPPAWVARISESPDLVRALAWALVAAAGIALALG